MTIAMIAMALLMFILILQNISLSRRLAKVEADQASVLSVVHNIRVELNLTNNALSDVHGIMKEIMQLLAIRYSKLKIVN